MDAISITAASITALAGIAVIGIGAAVVVAAASREQNRNEQQIEQVKGVIGRVAPIHAPGETDELMPARRRSAAPDEWNKRGAPPDEATGRGVDQHLLDGLAERTSARFEIQQAHYANALRQSTTYFYYSLGVGVAGCALLFTGVGLALADLAQVGAVTALGGIVADATAALVFNQANRAKADAQVNLSAIALAAEKAENNLMAYIYASRIEDAAMRDATTAALARRMADVGDHGAMIPTRTPSIEDDDAGRR